MKNQECSVLILSRDASWRQAYLTSVFFRKYWNDCPFDLCLCTQEQTEGLEYYDNVFRTDVSDNWGQRLRKALSNIKTEYVILCPEDDFLQSQVNTEKMQETISYCRENGVGAVRLAPPLLFTVPYTEKYDRVPKDSIYRLVLHPMLFRKSYLEKFAEMEYTPWQFEREGSLYSREFKDNILCAKEPLYDSVHAWSHGMWTREGYRLLKASGIEESMINFAKVYPWYKLIKDKIFIAIIKIAPNTVTKIRTAQAGVDNKKLSM